MNYETNIDISKSKVTREAIGLLLYGLYTAIKNSEKVALTKLIETANLPVPQIMQALKDCKVVENIGGKASSAQWKWIPSSPPNDLIIERVFNNYTTQLLEYRKKRQDWTDQRNGINREESGKAVKAPTNSNGTPSLYVQERLQILEDNQRYIIDLLETLAKAWGVQETLGGIKIGKP